MRLLGAGGRAARGEDGERESGLARGDDGGEGLGECERCWWASWSWTEPAELVRLPGRQAARGKKVGAQARAGGRAARASAALEPTTTTTAATPFHRLSRSSPSLSSSFPMSSGPLSRSFIRACAVAARSSRTAGLRAATPAAFAAAAASSSSRLTSARAFSSSVRRFAEGESSPVSPYSRAASGWFG